MIRLVLLVLVTLTNAAAQAQKVYKCSKPDGSLSFSSKPCASENSREEVVTIRSANSTAKPAQDTDSTAAAAPRTDLEVKQSLVGRWTLRDPAYDISYTMNLSADGRYESSGTDLSGSYVAKGTWTLQESTLVTEESVVTTMKDGSQFKTNATNRASVHAVDANNLILTSRGSDRRIHWKK